MSDAPKQQRGRRREREGVVTSDSRDQTIRVVVDYLRQDAKYGKYIRRRTKLHAHDANNEAKVGDRVRVAECRPMSKTKHWRLVEVLRHA
jgi:small subunit ribosomal protein S17